MNARLLLPIAAASVVTFDALASFASLTIGFPYAAASVGSFALYVAIGVLAARVRTRKFSFIAGAVAGLADATAGWYVSWIIGPGKPSSGSMNLTELALTVAVVTTLACLVAGISGIIATRGRADIRV
jgi:hypothetical protein